MNLSTLIKYRHGIELYNLSQTYARLTDELKELNADLSTFEINFDQTKEKILQYSDSAICNIKDIDQALERFKLSLDSLIETLEPDHYAKSTELYREFCKADTASYIFERGQQYPLFTDSAFLEFFSSRVKSYVSFKYPALEIRPLSGKISKDLVGCDPLYLADTNQTLLSGVRMHWTPAYQNRVRYYTYSENDLESLNRLPQQQFGLIVISEMFNYKPIEVIENYLKAFWDLLRPGGSVVFTFNDCDLPDHVVKYEHMHSLYTPGKKIKSICNTIGYNINYTFTLKNLVSWIEISKPGELISLRAGQTLGKIENI